MGNVDADEGDTLEPDWEADEDVASPTTPLVPFKPKTLEASQPLGEALKELAESGQTHALVMSKGRLLGVFHASSLQDAARTKWPESRWPLDQVVAQAVYTAPNESLGQVVKALRGSGAVLVGSEGDMQGMLTTAQVLETVAEFAEPFMVVADIERSIRAIVAHEVPLAERPELFARLLAHGERRPPTALNELTMADYATLITSRDGWPRFARVLVVRELVAFRLERIRVLRNELFHFRGILDPETLVELNSLRWWISEQWKKSQAQSAPTLEIIDGGAS